MAAFGFSVANGNIKINGIKSWKVISAGDSSGTINLGDLADGSITISTINQKTSLGRSQPIGADVTITAKMLVTPRATVLQLLDHLSGPAQMEIETVSGVFLLANVAATDKLGLSWRFDSSADYDRNRYIEVTARGKIIISGTDFDLDDLFASATNIASGSCSGGLSTWSTASGSGTYSIFPAGATAFETRNAGESTWETLGVFKNAKVVCETMDQIDSHGRNIPYGVRVVVEADMLQASATELELMDSVALGSPDFRVTLADGTIITLANNCGVSWSYSNTGDSDGSPMIHIIGDGVFSLTDFVALITP